MRMEKINNQVFTPYFLQNSSLLIEVEKAVSSKGHLAVSLACRERVEQLRARGRRRRNTPQREF